MGYTIKEGFKCADCNNSGLIDEVKKYKLNISKGSYSKKEIVIENAGDYIHELNKRNNL